MRLPDSFHFGTTNTLSILVYWKVGVYAGLRGSKHRHYDSLIQERTTPCTCLGLSTFIPFQRNHSHIHTRNMVSRTFSSVPFSGGIDTSNSSWKRRWNALESSANS